ncbi:MAG: YcgL domain-containing protein [Hahellaceae bacterium]|nr:YcgL domain-containing protein [Hahellaceae bacterium]
MQKRLVSVFRSPKKDEMYLYVDRQKGLEPVPAPLLERFGVPALVMHLMLGEERKLARVQAKDVLTAIETQGFFLQMPPPPDAEMQQVVIAREQRPTAGGRSDGES